MKNFLTLIFSVMILLTCAACSAVDEKNNFNEDIPNERQAVTLNLTTKKVLLNSGYEMPVIGLGTYALDYNSCVNSVVKNPTPKGGSLKALFD